MFHDFLVGCCYYPEHWDDGNMEADLRRIRDLGFNTVRMGEFAWSMFEKEDGCFDFSFLQKAVRSAEEKGIKVILGTPTAAPPVWLIKRHPEVLCVNVEGVTMNHGSRQHHNHTSEIYLQYCARIVEEMVKSFCGFSNVIGWQIDNEFNCHRNESFSEADNIAFRKWLQEKYGCIEALNAAWGTRFWSLEFNDFSQIECPRHTVAYRNPSIMTDYYLFMSDSVINYAEVQAKIIRKYMPQAFITHNGYFLNLDYKKLTEECLDFLSFDNYPAFFERGGTAKGRRAEYNLTRTRGCSERYLILEQQAGPGGQLSYLLPTPLPGQIRLWTYQSIAYGAVGVLYFRYRTALYGAEQLWYGIYDYDGEENHRSREIRQVAEEISRVGSLFLRERKHAEVAIYTDYHNVSCNKAEPFFADDHRSIFNTLNAQNVSTDIIYNLDELEKYKVVIFPHIAIADEVFAKRIAEFTKQGGIAILSARSGIKDKNAHYLPMKSPGVFRELAGCCADWFTSLAEHAKQFVELDGKRYPIEIYYETLVTEDGEPVATYTEGYANEKIAIVQKDNVYYLGFYCKENTDIYYDLVCKYIDVPIVVDPDLEEVKLGGYRMYLNHGDRKVKVSGYDLLKECAFDEIEPFGVALVKNDG